MKFIFTPLATQPAVRSAKITDAEGAHYAARDVTTATIYGSPNIIESDTLEAACALAGFTYEPAPPPPAPPDPAVVLARRRAGMTASNGRIRTALEVAGITQASVDAAIDALPDGPLKVKVNALWHYEPIFHRTDATLNQMAAALGLTPEQVDAIFAAA